MVRYTVLGLEKEIQSSVDPWLCYYCGDCSASCPRQADPGNLMMSLRRYLISKYDWTGLSGLLYRNLSGYIIAFVLMIAAVVGLYVNDTFTKVEWLEYGHYFEMFAIAGVFALILLPNLIRMWYLTVWKPTKKFKIKNYFIAISDLLVHMFTQKRSLDCDKEQRDNVWWFEHLLLVLSYLALLFTTVFLDWFENTNMIVIVMGYVFSAAIFIVTTDFVIRRIRKKSEKSKFTHPSDWFFVIWLLLMGVSAFAVRLLIDVNALENAFGVYLFHLIVLVQWALIIVPFGKWTHFLYRSFAMYYEKINALGSKAK
jgi:quinone-modifying oxidoreductase subunit QmoC